MGKMKKTHASAKPPAPMGTSAAPMSEDSNDRPMVMALSDSRTSLATKVPIGKDVATVATAGKSPKPSEKRTRPTLHGSSSGFKSPSKTGKRKQSPARKGKDSTAEFDNSSSACSSKSDEQGLEPDTSGIHGESEVIVHTIGNMATPLETDKAEDQAIEEATCRKILAGLRSKDKRPPQAMTAATFASQFHLTNEGINSHKLKIGRDITLEEVEGVFGQEKARNGFFWGEKLSRSLRKDAERLYCLCYQKPFAPTHVAKEFAIGFVLDKVKQQHVNWAEFAAQTNLTQRKSYLRRLRGCIVRLATALGAEDNDIFDEEGFAEYAPESKQKLPLASDRHDLGEHNDRKADVAEVVLRDGTGSVNASVLVGRKKDIQFVVQKLQYAVNMV